MRAHLDTPPPPIARLCPDVPAGLADVLDRMLAKAPANRFLAPAEVAEALRPFTSGADLAGLRDAGAAAAPSAGVPTPAPGLGETAQERSGRGRPGPVVLPRYALAVAVGAFALLLAAALLWLTPGEPAKPAAKSVEITEMHVSHYRDRGATSLGNLRTSTEAIRVNDDVRIAAELSSPAYHYLIAFNPDGEDQLCLPEDSKGRGAPDVRPDRRADVRYPGKESTFVLDAKGLQAFVLAASSKPLPPYKEWRDGAREIPWKANKVSPGLQLPRRQRDGWRWHFDGREFTHFPEDRGKIEPKEAAPESFRKLCEFFKGRAEFDAVQAIAFPVADEK
jgi:hypothetical protein